MKKNRELSIWLPAAAAIICAVTPSRAVIETETLSPISYGSSPFPEMLNLPEFNSALGTLTGVSITVSESTSIRADVVNFGPATSFTGATATGTTTLSGLLGLTYSDTFSSAPFSGSIPDGTSSPTFMHGPYASGSSAQTTAISTVDLSSYEYTGSPASIPFTVGFLGNYAGSGSDTPGELFFGGDATINGTVKVTYTYDTVTPVPEAGTLWAGLCALGGSAAMLRSRIRSLRFFC